MKRVHVIDLDLNKYFRARLRFDKRNGAYYISYAKNALDSVLGFYQKVYISTSDINANVFVVKDRKAYVVNFNSSDSNSVNANPLTIDSLREIVRSKIVYNLLTPSMAVMAVYVLMGIGIGIGIGFMLHSYLPPEIFLQKSTNTTTTVQQSTITTTTIPLR